MAEPNEEPRDEEPTSRQSEPPADEHAGEPDGAPSEERSDVREAGSAAARRLAARRAAKQALKAARRRAAESAEGEARIEDEAEKVAVEASRWATRHRNVLLSSLLGLLVLLGGAVAWSRWHGGALQARAEALWKGVSAAAAPVVPEGSTPPLGAEETFPSVAAQAEAAAERFGKAASELNGVHAAWARLGQGAALLQLGKLEEARKAFEAALDASGNDVPHVRAGALEGLAHVAEAEEKWDEATNRYEALGKVAVGRYRPLSELGLARVEAAREEREAAVGRLKKLLARLDGSGEGSGGPVHLPYIRDRAEAALRSLDPSYAPAPRVLGGGGGISQEQLQRLLEQIRRQKQGGGTAP